MKNYRWPAVLVLGTLMALPFASAVRADEGGPQSANDGEAHHWKHDGHDGEHGHMGITDDQKAKLKSIMEAQEKALKPIWRKQRDLSFKLADQLEDKAGDADIQNTLSDLKANREIMETQTKRFRTEREAIFTPTQRARMMLAHKFDGEHRGHWDHRDMDGRDGEHRHHDSDGEDHDGGRDM